MKDRISACLPELSMALDCLELILGKGYSLKESLKDNKRIADKVISQAFSTVHALIKQREEVLLVESNQVVLAKEAHLALQLQQLEELKQEIAGCVQLVTASEVYGNIEFLSIAPTLQLRMEQLMKQFSDAQLELCESASVLVEINTDLVKPACNSFHWPCECQSLP